MGSICEWINTKMDLLSFVTEQEASRVQTHQDLSRSRARLVNIAG